MADNRLYLVDKKNKNNRILLAKYYQDTGWYMYLDMEKFDDWFDDNINYDRSLFGHTDLTLEYEETKNDNQNPTT